MKSIIWYGDYIAPDFGDENLWNRYLEQHIDNYVDDVQHFTGQPQVDSASFRYFSHKLEFKTFDEYLPGYQGLIIIGLHGGWSLLKLQLIKSWFLSDANRTLAWNDSQCQIVLDYSEEGFTTEVFPELWTWIEDNNLQERILYVSSSCNVSSLYSVWCMKHRINANMRATWYGFFTNWIIRDREMCRIRHELPNAEWQPGSKRFMCLNRRPHPHRILLTALLERFNLIEHGAVSMPLDFYEPEVTWQDDDFDTKHQWHHLKERFNGSLDSLEPDFQRMYAKLPLVADTDNFGINYALNLNSDFYKDYPINVISETLFFSEATFASEKIWKPMLLGQIFIVMAAPFYLQSIRKLGFKTFSPWINEEYDLIDDPVDRAVELVKTIKSITKLSDSEFGVLLEKCRPVLEHNKQILLDFSAINKLVSKQVVEAIEEHWDF